MVHLNSLGLWEMIISLLKQNKIILPNFPPTRAIIYSENVIDLTWKILRKYLSLSPKITIFNSSVAKDFVPNSPLSVETWFDLGLHRFYPNYYKTCELRRIVFLLCSEDNVFLCSSISKGSYTLPTPFSSVILEPYARVVVDMFPLEQRCL